MHLLAIKIFFFSCCLSHSFPAPGEMGMRYFIEKNSGSFCQVDEGKFQIFEFDSETENVSKVGDFIYKRSVTEVFISKKHEKIVCIKPASVILTDKPFISILDFDGNLRKEFSFDSVFTSSFKDFLTIVDSNYLWYRSSSQWGEKIYFVGGSDEKNEDKKAYVLAVDLKTDKITLEYAEK